MTQWLERQGYWICVWIGLVAIALYAPTISFGYVNLDDPWLIKNNVLLHSLDFNSLYSVWLDLSTSQRLRLGGEYLPVRDTSVMIDFFLFGDWVHGFHITQVALYGLMCAALSAMLLAWMRSRWVAFVGGMLFVVHPLHVEAVSWLSERKGLLAGLFMFLSMLLFQRFVVKGKIAPLVGALVFAVLGVWSKAIAITTVGLLAALLWFFPPWKDHSVESCSETSDNSTHASMMKRAWLGWLLLSGAIVLAFLPVWLAGKSVNMVRGYHGGGLGATFWLMGKVHATYILQLLGISGLAIKYPVAVGDGQTILAVFGLIAGVVVVFVALFGLWSKRFRLFSFAAWAWMIFLAPVSQILLPIQNYIADRYMLLPSLSFVLVLAYLLRKFPNNRISTIAFAGLVLLFSINTLMQSQSWSSTRSLYIQALRVHPTWVPGMMQLAHIEAKAGRYKQAQALVSRAKKVNPHHPKVAIRESLLLLRKRKIGQAINVLRKAATTSKDDKVSANLALLLHRTKKFKEAYKWAKQAVSIRAMIPHNQRVLGIVALSLKHYQVARIAFEFAYKLEPFKPQNSANLGVLFHHLKQPQKAAYYFQQAQTIARQRSRRR